jgi:hypothetical protein
MTKNARFSSRIYRSWENMKRRCSDPGATAFNRYGGLDLTYEPRWKSFTCFEQDMGPMPEGYTLERKDNNKGYTKENCIWATPATQARNRSNTKLSAEKVLEIRKRYFTGEATQAGLAREFCVSQAHISKVLLNRAWSNGAEV